MSSIRVANTLLIARYARLQCRHLSTQRHFARRCIPVAQRQTLCIQPSLASFRSYSTPETPQPKLYDFQQIKSLSASPSPDRVIIDVREPDEYASGYIPTAINLPIKSQPDALFLPAEEFQERFGFSKPAADTEVVFYCRAGVRATTAAQLAQQIGYNKISEYRGSMLDWEKHGGPLEKP